MIWLLVGLLALAGLLILAFVALDAKQAFDGDPTTPTLSSKIKAWRRRGHTGGRTLLLVVVLVEMFGLPLVYLVGHLGLELW